jgi:hypothetical protein
MLHNALGKRDEFEGTHKHVGITNNSLFVMGCLMGAILIGVIAIMVVQV